MERKRYRLAWMLSHVRDGIRTCSQMVVEFDTWESRSLFIRHVLPQTAIGVIASEYVA
jgi:hypothetical protein